MTKLSFKLFLFLIMISSCRKTIETINEPLSLNDSQITQKFFTIPSDTKEETKKIIEEIKKRNNNKEFVTSFVKNNGYPIWNKVISLKSISNNDHGNQFSYNSQTSTDTIVYIPLELNNQNKVNGFIKAAISDSIYLSYSLAEFYKNYPQISNLTDVSSKEFASALMYLDKKTFGNDEFQITDKRLFHNSMDFSDTANISRKVKISENNTSTLLASICYRVTVWTITANWHCTNSGECTSGTCDACNLCVDYSLGFNIENQCYDEEIGGPIGGSGGSGGGGGGDIPPYYPCTPVLNPNFSGTTVSNTLPGSPLPPCPAPIGGMGWGPIVPYVCNYQLSTRDQEVIDEINAEDNVANNNNQNNCKGTKRTGNINFQGTKEHWLIELDFIAKNPLNGEIEYSIPNASMTNPANKGYADMVNTNTGGIFEIKPNNPAGLSNGTIEVNNYVLKANLNCSPPTQIGTSWNKGNSYTTTLIPTGIINNYLKAELIAPGVVGYSNISNPITIPSPILVPQSAIDKIKQLVERLRNNVADANRIIAEYLNQHPELVTYIKSAAIGAGVAIIIGTILEDFLTLGAGIADDAASFALAYKVIRFAIKL